MVGDWLNLNSDYLRCSLFPFFSIVWKPQNCVRFKNIIVPEKILEYLDNLFNKELPSGVVVALCAPNPQFRGSVLELGKEDSPFHTFSGSIN